MATTIRIKNSVVSAKAPSAGDLVLGELALNANSNTPALYFKDNADNIIKLEPGSGVVPSPDPPSTPSEGDLWYNENTNALNYWDGTQWVELGQAGDSPVTSVNGEVGVVVLDAADVGALTDGDWSSYGDAVEVKDDDLFVLSRDGVALTISGSEVGGGGTPKPIEPTPDEISGPISGTGTQLDPFILSSVSVSFGQAAVSVESITITGQRAGALVIFEDANAGTNGTRFSQSTGVVGADGTWSSTLNFNDSPASTVAGTYTGLLNLFETEVYFQWEVSVEANATIDRPSVLAPPNNAGIGGDITYTPRTSSVVSTNTVIVPGGWETASATEANSWYSVVYGNGKFVAVSGNGTNQVMYSTDGINWTSASATGDSNWASVTYGNGKFVAVASDGTSQAMYSDDGINWTSATTEPFTKWRSVTYGGGKFVAVADDGTNRVMYSTNGTSWTSASAAEANRWCAVTYGGGKFVAVAIDSNRVMYSADGISWTAASAPEANKWWSVTYGDGKFVAVSFSGDNRVMYSADGISWTSASAPEANDWYAVTYGDDKFVAVAGDGTNRVMHSTDGINWTSASAAEANSWRGVTYGDGKFVAVANTGTNRVMSSLYGNDGYEVETLTLTDSKTYNNADGADMLQPISETFSAGQTVTAESTTVFANEPAFSTTLYTGSGFVRNLTIDINNSGKSLIWIKDIKTGGSAGSSEQHHLSSDVLEGKYLDSSGTNPLSATPYDHFTSFFDNKVGLSVANGVNKSSNPFVAWSFRAAPGFMDAVKYIGGPDNKEIPHALGSKPGLILIKNLDESENWVVYHQSITANNYLRLNRDAQVSTSGDLAWNNTEPTASAFTVGSSSWGGTNKSGGNYIAYLFGNTAGQIKCSSYTGNATSFNVSTGFKVGWLMIKRVAGANANWLIFDNKRASGEGVKADRNEEPTDFSRYIEFDSTDGFDLTNTFTFINEPDAEFVYIAIAEDALAPPNAATGTVASAIDNILTLTDVNGTWSPGDFAVNDEEVTKNAPGAEVLEFVGSTPQDVPADSVDTWGDATWQVSTDVGFTSPMVGTKLISNAEIPQTLDENERGAIVLADDTQYWARVKYAATSPDVASSYSAAVTFKTAAATAVTDNTPITFFDPESFQALSEYQVERRFGIDPNKVNTNKLPVNRLTNEPTGVTATFVQEGDRYRPIEDQTGTVNRLNSEVNAAQEKVAAAEAAVASLEIRLLARITALEEAATTSSEPEEESSGY